MKSTLFDSNLFTGKFGSYLLDVFDLTEWMTKKIGGFLVTTDPPIENYEYVSVEFLLRAYLQSMLDTLTPNDGFLFAKYDPKLKDEPLAKHPITARWFVGIKASTEIKNIIVNALKKGELTLLNFEDKAPITDKELDALFTSLSQVNQSSAGSDGLINWLSQLPHTQPNENLINENTSKATWGRNEQIT